MRADSSKQFWLFRGLALRFGVLGLVITLLTSGFITVFSVRSLEEFLSARIDRRFPDALERARERLDLWYRQRSLDVETFAQHELVVSELRGQGGGKELERYLAYVLERFPQYRALLLVDAQGNPRIAVGDGVSLPHGALANAAAADHSAIGPILELEGQRIQLVSSPVGHGSERTLVAVLRSEAMAGVLVDGEARDGPSLAVIDPKGSALVGTAPPLARTGSHAEPSVIESDDGERTVVATRDFGRFGLALVAHEPYAQAYEPVERTVDRAVLVGSLAVAIAGALAFMVGSWRARPLLHIVDAARRLAEGETEVEVPVSRTGDEIQLLARSFNHMAGRLRENRFELETRNRELQAANEVLEQLSITDGLTKLHNHRHFQDQFVREARRARRTGRPLALILIDIDDFKRLNDSLGHAVGDAVLEHAAETMFEVARETDFLARYGGEEFAVLATDTDQEGAAALAEKIRSAIALAELPVLGPEGPVHITISLGVAMFDGSGPSTFEAADRALYEAKQSGKDRVCVATCDPADPSGSA